MSGTVRDWRPPVSDDAVAAKTGRTWAEWIELLDARGCAGMSHREIVAVVGGAGAGPWWQQSVTVGYERARGLRAVHQTSRGFGAGVSKTVKAPLAALWQAWMDEQVRARWLPEGFTARGASAEKSLRINWPDGSDVQVLFTAKGADRTQVSVEHGKLESAARVAEVKAFWRGRLEALKALLEAT